jgi:hypothetical protein
MRQQDHTWWLHLLAVIAKLKNVVIAAASALVLPAAATDASD